jgi:mRNA interferase RelE/StbE
MNIVYKPKFKRDVDKVNNAELLIALQEKIVQVKKAKDKSQITGLKLLRGFSTHYRIIVKTDKLSYRIGAIIRKETISMVRFLPRKIIYRDFP